MDSTRRPPCFAAWPKHLAVLGALLLSLVVLPRDTAAQTPEQFQSFSTCVLPPLAPGADTWPVAAPDSLGTMSSASVTVSAATLLANDRGTSLAVVTVGPASTGGGTVTGTDPFTFTVAPGFQGADIFPYEIRDGSGQTSVGLVKVNAVGDAVAPTVSITAPLAGASVAGSVVVSASAADNIGIAGVRFFDGLSPLGGEVTAAPFQAAWDTTVVPNGSHSLTAVARDPAGNTSTSAAVGVTVANVVNVAVPTVDRKVTSQGLGRRTTPAFSTTSAGEVLVAFAASDGPPAADGQSLTISGAGLTWTRVRRAAARFGDSEIWTATAPAVLTNATVTSTQSATGFHQMLTVVAFSGVGGIGASSVASAATGAPAVSLVTQAPGSLVYAVGNDWDRAVARTVPAGQTKVQEFVDTAVGDTFWVQASDAAIPAAGTPVTLSDSAPINDQWNYAMVELTPGGVAVPPPPPPPPPAPPAATGPVLALSFNEPAGTTANDASGYANNGTIAGANHVTGPSGFGGALAFDGVDDWVTVPDAAALDLTAGLTIEAWVNPSTVNGWETVLLKERGVGNLAYGLYAADGTSLLGGVDGPAGYENIGGTHQAVRSGTGLPLGAWTHVATTYDGTTERLYVNGALVASRAQTGNIVVSASPLRIGGNNAWAGEFFQGLIDEVRVYNRALSPAEVVTDMNTPLQ